MHYIIDGEERELIKLEDLPHGTKLEDKKKYTHIRHFEGRTQFQEISKQKKPNDSMWDNCSNLSTEEMYVLPDEKIIYPYGYQTPLWKVLNGE